MVRKGMKGAKSSTGEINGKREGRKGEKLTDYGNVSSPKSKESKSIL
jgi:ribosome-associated protein YbcJ (S4-like RNA binding protein)